MAQSNFALTIDASDVEDLIETLSKNLSPEATAKAMQQSMADVGKRGKVQIRKAVQKEYEASAAWINRSIKAPKVTASSGGFSVKFPLSGERGNIGSTFPVRKNTGSPAWFTPKYSVKYKILKGTWQTLQGGFPPFRNTKAQKLNGLIYKRQAAESKQKAMDIYYKRSNEKKAPIEKMVGLAMPQMPLNRARGETEDRLLELAEKRVMHYFSRAISRR